MTRTMQSSFAAGEITPALHGRVGSAEYQRGLALAENFFVSIYGGLVNRPGTRFIRETAPATRLIPFQIGEAEGVALGFSTNFVNFYARGGTVQVLPTNAVVNSSVAPIDGFWRSLSTGGATIGNGPNIQDVGRLVGTVIGDLIEGGGNAAAFDGSASQASNACATAARPIGAVGKSWGADRIVTGARVTAASDTGFSGARQSIAIVLQASLSNFTADIVEIARTTLIDGPGVTASVGDVDFRDGYPYHRVAVFGSTGADLVAVAEVVFTEYSLAAATLLLRGSPNSKSHAEQKILTAFPGREHVLPLYIDGGAGLYVQVGLFSADNSLLPPTYLRRGWHTVAFTPTAGAFYLQFFHFDPGAIYLDIEPFIGSGATVPQPLYIPHPLLQDDLPDTRFTQDANSLTLTNDHYPALVLSRGVSALAWSMEYKVYGPSLASPVASALTISRIGSGSGATHIYVVTYVGADGQESLPSGPISAAGAVTLSLSEYIRIVVAQPLPADTVACAVYKLFGGTYGLMGLCVGQFDDVGQAPKTDQTPPANRAPFDDPSAYPQACSYWEQRLVLAGSAAYPESVELSQPGNDRSFRRSSPSRDDDAITFTPAGPQVRRIRHALGGQDLALFTDASVVVARRGDNALTPALEGGVRQVLGRGIGRVRPMLIDRNYAFVGADNATVRLLDQDYQESEVSLSAEHLFRGRTVVDWAYQEIPYSMLWLAMSDGQMVTLSLLPKQGVIGWARARTDGEVQSICAVREGDQDRVYLRCRRWLRGDWRNTVEVLALRKIEDVRDAYFVDCGLSLDQPKPVIAMVFDQPGQVTVSASGLAGGDQIDIGGTGIDGLDDRRFTVLGVNGSLITVDADWTGLGPWRGGGSVRKVVTAVSGLDHLEGSSVTVLNTGNVEGPYTVAGGAVALANPGSRVHVGLAYQALGSTLAVSEAAEPFGRRKNVHEIQVLTRDTRALEFGPTFERMDTKSARSTERFGEPIGLKSETQEITLSGNWGLGGKLVFRQAFPLPAEILSITPVYERSTG